MGLRVSTASPPPACQHLFLSPWALLLLPASQSRRRRRRPVYVIHARPFALFTFILSLELEEEAEAGQQPKALDSVCTLNVCELIPSIQSGRIDGKKDFGLFVSRCCCGVVISSPWSTPSPWPLLLDWIMYTELKDCL